MQISVLLGCLCQAAISSRCKAPKWSNFTSEQAVTKEWPPRNTFLPLRLIFLRFCCVSWAYCLTIQDEKVLRRKREKSEIPSFFQLYMRERQFNMRWLPWCHICHLIDSAAFGFWLKASSCTHHAWINQHKHLDESLFSPCRWESRWIGFILLFRENHEKNQM